MLLKQISLWKTPLIINEIGFIPKVTSQEYCLKIRRLLYLYT